MKKTLLATALLTTLIASPTLLANQAGDILIRGGATMVDPDSDKSDVYLNDANSGLRVSVDDDTQLGLNFVYFFENNFAIEVLAATPFTHDIKLHADGADTTTLAEVTHLPPTVSALYYFDTTSNFKPYAGVGFNYTVFYDEEFKSGYKDAGFNDLDLDSSWGFAFQVGADYHLNDKWHINSSIRYIDINTDADFKVGESVKGHAGVDVNPMVYSVMLGYKF